MLSRRSVLQMLGLLSMLNYNAGLPVKYLTADVIKQGSVTVTDATPQTLWTPTAGKKIILMGFTIFDTTAGTIATLRHGTTAFMNFWLVLNTTFLHNFPGAGLDIFGVNEVLALVHSVGAAHTFWFSAWGREL